MLDISVVIPVYNGEKYLRACLESVLASISPVREILLIDDGSTDGTLEIAREFSQVQCFRQDNLGASAARNLGVKMAVGEWLAFMDADDLMLPGRLADGWEYLASRPELDGVFGEVEQFSDPPGAFPHDPRRQQAQLPGTFMVRRSTFERAGLFAPEYRAAEFVDWVLRAQEMEARFALLPELVLRRRLHAHNSGRLKPETRQDYAKVVMAALRRRRQVQESPT